MGIGAQVMGVERPVADLAHEAVLVRVRGCFRAIGSANLREDVSHVLRGRVWRDDQGPAICALLLPAAMSRKTSTSRSLKPAGKTGPPGGVALVST